jgi:hypothetical protein
MRITPEKFCELLFEHERVAGDIALKMNGAVRRGAKTDMKTLDRLNRHLFHIVFGRKPTDEEAKSCVFG